MHICINMSAFHIMPKRSPNMQCCTAAGFIYATLWLQR